MKIFLICGEAGAGKSTFVRTMSNRGYATFHSGAVFKRISPQMKVKPGEDMESPESVEKEIHDSLFRFLDKYKTEKAVFVETVPRSVESLNWVDEMEEIYGVGSVTAIWFRLSKNIRIERIKKREAGRIEFDLRRIESEDHVKHSCIIYGLTSKLLEGNLLFHDGQQDVEEYAEWVEKSIGPEDCTRLHHMMNSAVNVYAERDGYARKHADFKRMISRIREELDELEEAATMSAGGGRNEAIDGETADVMHFFFCLADSVGMTPEDLERAFHKKTTINQARLHFPNADKHAHDGKLY